MVELFGILFLLVVSLCVGYFFDIQIKIFSFLKWFTKITYRTFSDIRSLIFNSGSKTKFNPKSNISTATSTLKPYNPQRFREPENYFLETQVFRAVPPKQKRAAADIKNSTTKKA